MTARALLGLAARTVTVFNLDGHLAATTDAASPYNTTSTIDVRTDGNIFEGNSINGLPVVYTQRDTATDWIRPVVLPTQYFVRYSNVVGTFTSTPGAVDTAIALTTDREWTVNRTGFGTSTVTFDLEILDTDQTTVLAGPSAYQVEAENTV